jgi:hypothetical protein
MISLLETIRLAGYPAGLAQEFFPIWRREAEGDEQ